MIVLALFVAVVFIGDWFARRREHHKAPIWPFCI